MSPRVGLEPLRHRTFRLFLVGRTASLLGNMLAGIAVAFAVLDLTGSATDLGIVLAARSVPMVVFLLLGGVIADRLPRHRVLVVANLVAGASQAIAATLLLTGTATIATLVAAEAVNGASSAMVLPASSGLIPQTVPRRLLQEANALARLGQNSALVGGAAVGGVVVAAVGSGWAVAFDAATFFVSAAFLGAIRLDPQARVPGGNVLSELRDGWRDVTGRSWLWVVIVAFGFANAAHAGGFLTLGPVIADATFGPAGWGLVVGAETVGMFVGGLLMLRLRLARPLLVGMLGTLPWAGVMLVLALWPQLAPLVVIGVLAGIGLEFFSVGWDLSVQENIPADRLSRVYSYDMLGSFVMIPVGQAAVGPVAGVFGVTSTLLGCAGLVAASMLLAFAVPSVRRLRRLPQQEPVTAP